MEQLEYEREWSIQEMHEWLLRHEPRETGPEVVYRLRKGKRRRVGRVRLYVPGRNDHPDLAGNMFSDWYVVPSETYLDRKGNSYTGRELLELYGVVVGSDATDAMAWYLKDAVEVLPLAEMLRLGNAYQVDRGRLAAILGARVKAHTFKKNNRKVLVLVASGDNHAKINMVADCDGALGVAEAGSAVDAERGAVVRSGSPQVA